MRISQTIDMSRLTWIIPRLRHSYYIRDRDSNVGGFNRLCRFISQPRQCSLTWNIRQSPYRRHVRARYFLLSHSCRIACDTRIYSSAMRRLRFSRNADLSYATICGFFGWLQEMKQGQGRPFQNGGVIGGGSVIYDRFDAPAFHPRHYLSTCRSPKVTQIRIVSLTHPF